MSWKAFIHRLNGTQNPDAIESDMDEEFQFHVEMATKQYIDAGMTPEEARRRAIVAFGGVESVKEEGREARRARVLENMFADVKFAIRSIRRAPAFATAALLTMAVAIGANTAVFSVINGALLRPLPFPGEGEVKYVAWDWGQSGSIPALTAFQYEYVRDNARTLKHVARYTPSEWTMSEDVRIDPARGIEASPEFFDVIGMHPALGRAFDKRDVADNASRVVVLGHDFWRRQLASDRNVIGRTITLDNEPRTVIGVMPPSYRFPAEPENLDYIAPLKANARRADEGHNSTVFARTLGGSTPEQIAQDVAHLSASFRAANPDLASPKEGFLLMSHSDVQAGDIRKTLFLLFGAVLSVLLIGCSNTANLLLVRAAGRRQEIAVRASLGAGRRRIAQQLVIEGLVLATVAGALGVALGTWGLHQLMAFIPASPAIADISLDGRVMFFAFGITLVTGLVFGLTAALPALRTDLNSTLRGSGRGTTSSSGRVREMLVLVETAVAVVLLAGAGLLIASFNKMQSVDPGFKASQVVAVRYGRLSQRYQSEASLLELQQRILDQIKRVPGVQSAAVAPSFPMERGLNFPIDPVDHEDNWMGAAEIRAVSADYLRTLGVGIQSGRDFTDADGRGERVAIINRKLADHYWPGENAVGKSLHIGHLKGEWMSQGFIGEVHIVGVSDDFQDKRLDSPARYTVIVPATQWAGFLNSPKFMVRTSDVRGVIPVLQGALAGMTPDMKAPEIVPLADIVQKSVATPKFRALLLTVFAACSLLLAIIGIYGVIASMVQQKTREIGLRMALGASSIGIAAVVMRRCALLLALGMVIGTAGALGTTRLLTAMLFEVTPTDPRVFAAVLAVLAAGGLVAGFVPAHRAARVDPGVTLRSE